MIFNRSYFKFRKCKFEYTPRTEKSLVNSIAAETLKSKKEIFLIGRVPEYVEKQKERDSVREPD